jgi:phospholipid/cholesterol/gamma-HCH transport system ATP-binding protein
MITITNLKRRFNNHWVLKGVNLTIPEGKMTCIIGRSGEGKSVLLKSIIGLLKPTSGSITINGQEVTQLSESEKRVIFQTCGYVFQFAALLDSLTIFENVGITLLEQGMKEESVLPIVKEKLSLVHLGTNILNKYPSDLSGGMRKRVGIARTLVTNPSIILYDEPTTGLDPITSHVVHNLMADMQKRFQVTSVVISHDTDIFKYVDYVALLHDGEIKFFGDAKSIWESENPYIYQFIRGLTEGPIQADEPQKR